MKKPRIRSMRLLIVVATILSLITACSDSTSTSPPVNISGTVTGLNAGQQVILLNNGANATTVASNTTFTFSTTIFNGGTYAVTVGTQPTGQTCTVTNGSGSNVTTDVTNVAVACVNNIPTVSLLAGQLIAGSVDSPAGPGSAAQFDTPMGTATYGGFVYVADMANSSVRKIVVASGAVTTPFNSLFPLSIAITSSGNKAYVTDSSGGAVNVFDLVTNTLITSVMTGLTQSTAIAINGALAYVTDEMSGTIVVIDTTTESVSRVISIPGASQPYGIAFSPDGLYAYFADKLAHAIFKIDLSNDSISLLAGTTQGYLDGSALSAQFDSPHGLVVDGAGNIYVADKNNQVIRKIAINGNVSTYAGTVAVSGAANGLGTVATFNQPIGLALDSSGNIYVADVGNNMIRKIAP